MNIAEFCRRFEAITGFPHKSLDQRVRRMREAGILPRGAGRHTPNITPHQAVEILIGIGASDNISKVPDLIEPISQLRLSIEDLRGMDGYENLVVRKKLGEDVIDPGHELPLNFFNALEQLIMDPEFTEKWIKEVTICRTAPMATITFKYDEIFAVFKKYGTKYPLFYCGCTISGEVLVNLGIEIERVAGGWTGK